MYFHTKHVAPPPPPLHRLHPTIKGESAKSVFGNINRAGVACGEGAILCDRGGAVTCVACRHAQTRDTRHGQIDRQTQCGRAHRDMQTSLQPPWRLPGEYTQSSADSYTALLAESADLCLQVRRARHVNQHNLKVERPPDECFRLLWLCFDRVLTFFNSVCTLKLV